MHSGYSFGKPTHASHTTKKSRSPTIILLPWFLFKVEVIYHFRAWKRTISFLYQNLAIYNFVFVITFVWINFSKIQTVRTKLWVFKTFLALKYDFWISGGAGKNRALILGFWQFSPFHDHFAISFTCNFLQNDRTKPFLCSKWPQDQDLSREPSMSIVGFILFP